MKKVYIGIDNGVTGTIGFICDKYVIIEHTPIKKMQDYTKTKKIISRIDVVELANLLQTDDFQPFALIERPMVNPTRFNATMSAIRALEATLCVLESLKIPYQFIDSKEWQKELLPSGCSGNDLKTASYDIGKRLFPNISIKHTDMDGLLIAEYARRKNF